MPPSYHRRIYLLISGVVFVLAVWTVTPPPDFPRRSIVTVPDGRSLGEIAEILEEENIVRSPFLFRVFSVLLGGERRMKAGEYYFGRPQSVLLIAWRVSRGDRRIETVKLTVPEGFTVAEISGLFGERFPLFDNKFFEAEALEGYLFPDTYFMPVTSTATSAVKVMRDNFVRKIFPVMPDIELSGKSLEDIVIMASLLEAEAKTKLDREMASDVLWKRLKLGMPLQVDSYMWTYEFTGLPEEPINNPGLISIQAAVHPTTTPYLYFLSDKDGKMHYARTFEQHQTNIAKYLR